MTPTPGRSVRRRFVRRWTPPPPRRAASAKVAVTLAIKQINGDTLSFSILAMPGIEQEAMLHGYMQTSEGLRAVTLPVRIRASIT